MEETTPRVSVIVPAYNEEGLLERSLTAMIERLEETLEDKYEIVLCENGSTDRTLAIARQLSERYPQIRVESLPQPSYGRALRQGIAQARGRDVVIFNVDFWNAAFLQKAVGYLTYYDVVVGSKTVKGARDLRPWHRRLITRIFNLLLCLFCGFHGTDGHGIKAFNRLRIAPIVAQCQSDQDIFDTEVVLRAQRGGLRYREIPVTVREMRPTRHSLWRRLPKGIAEVFLLARILRRVRAVVEEVLEEERM